MTTRHRTRDTGHGATWTQAPPDDELTPEEIASYKMFRIKFEGFSWPFGHLIAKHHITLGITFAWSGWNMWRITIATPYKIHFIFNTYDAYKKYKLALGPYRNA